MKGSLSSRWWWRRGRGWVLITSCLIHVVQQRSTGRGELLGHQRLWCLAICCCTIAASCPCCKCALPVAILARLEVGILPWVTISLSPLVSSSSIAGNSAITVIPSITSATIFATHSPVTFFLVHHVWVIAGWNGAVPRSATSTATTTSVIYQLHEFRIDSLVSFLKHLDQLTRLFEVSRSEESVRCAFIRATGRASDTVHVILGAIWVIIVNDELDIFHVCSVIRIFEVSGWKKIHWGRGRKIES